jgi:hypothetical protein
LPGASRITQALHPGYGLSAAVAGYIAVGAGYSAAFLTLAAIAAGGLALFVTMMPETGPNALELRGGDPALRRVL